MYGATRVVAPGSLQELQHTVREASGPIRAVGRGHSFSPVCEASGGTVVVLSRLRQVLQYDPPTLERSGSVTFEGGATYSDLIEYLRDSRVPGAFRNLPSPCPITVAGAVATATHGSGARLQGMASHVMGLELVKADGELVTYSNKTHSMEEIQGVAVSLGCAGIVSKLTLEVIPAFTCRIIWIPTRLDVLIDNFHVLAGSGDSEPVCDSFNAFCHWPAGVCNLVLRRFLPCAARDLGAFGHAVWTLHLPVSAVDPLATLHNAGVVLGPDGRGVLEILSGTMASHTNINVGWTLIGVAGKRLVEFSKTGVDEVLRSVANEDAALMFEAPLDSGFEKVVFPGMSLSDPTWEGAHVFEGPWSETLPFYRAKGRDVGPGPAESSPDGQQCEFFVPMDRATEALRAAREVMSRWQQGDANRPEADGFFHPTDVRCVKATPGWLSPFPVDVIGFSVLFTGKPELLPKVLEAFPDLEAALTGLGARPHWGKHFSPGAFDMERLYGSGLHKFRELCAKNDPTGKFRNSWVREVLFTPQ